MSDSRELRSLPLRNDLDHVALRRFTRDLARSLGFGLQDQTRLATAGSELARVVLARTSEARATFSLARRRDGTALVLAFRGPAAALGQLSQSATQRDEAIARAVIAAKSLASNFAVAESGEDVVVSIEKELLAAAPDPSSIAMLQPEPLRRDSQQVVLAELEAQNRELAETLLESQAREEELDRLNGELEDTNRGVLALYAELDDRAERMRDLNDIKTKFLSYMSHEFRTPLSSIIALSRILLARSDGELTGEQEKQVELIHSAALDLHGTINDLLDLSKIEAGRVEIRHSSVLVADVFSALRGMLRPLAADTDVTLTFHAPDPALRIVTDEPKLSQILRNFVSNALKFTPRGTIDVSAVAEGGFIRFSVKDSGIGIAPEDAERIFDEFSQIDSPLQRQVTGTGLGLPLCRKLARLLGGDVEVVSERGKGSDFRAVLPAMPPKSEDAQGEPVLQ